VLVEMLLLLEAIVLEVLAVAVVAAPYEYIDSSSQEQSSWGTSSIDWDDDAVLGPMGTVLAWLSLNAGSS